MPEILIVADNDADLKRMGHELCKAGYETATARSGREALARARAELPDVVLLDVLLPGMNGFDTCRRFKAEPLLASIPVLMWASPSSPEDVVRGLDVGARDFVAKPLVPEVLHARLRAVLREKREQDALRDANRKLEEAQRAARNALGVRNVFLSHVSHELRTPLTSLYQFLTIVIDGLAGELNAQQKEYLDISLRNARQLRSMISDLMDVTRLQNEKLRIAPRPLDANTLVHEVVRAEDGMAAMKDVTLSATVDDIPEVIADDVRMRQVLTHLIENAITFTPEGGLIEVRAERDAEAPGFVRVSVSDNGCGVNEESKARIFDYMEQEAHDDWRSRKGLGIGLYICRELVVRQGGRIWVESDGCTGSTFSFTIPEFDFSRVVSPALLEEGRLREEFALLRVDIAPSNPDASRGLPDTVSRRAYHLVGASLYPGDVLLPRSRRKGVRDTYFVAAGTDEVGMESLRSRICSRLAQRVSDRGEELAISVQAKAVRPGAEIRARTDALEAAAREIADLTRIDSNWSQ